jgi:hypothetical protein
VNAAHQAHSVQESAHLINQLLDIKRNLDSFADVAGIDAGASRFGVSAASSNRPQISEMRAFSVVSSVATYMAAVPFATTSIDTQARDRRKGNTKKNAIIEETSMMGKTTS